MVDTKADIICDSIGQHAPRLTTFKLRYPKLIHGELMTHRKFTRSASSSRAVPVAKNLEEVRSDELRAGPVYWGAEQRGMQSGEELSDHYLGPRHLAQNRWAQAARSAADHAEELVKIGAHKSIVNRILEPFLHINVLVTATEFMNFFGLRLDKDAQPEIRALAHEMWAAYNESRPTMVSDGAWHAPFLEDNDFSIIDQICEVETTTDPTDLAIRVSVARCARISYESFETGKRSTVAEDIKLCDRLAASGHWSPFEHVAAPDQFASPKEFLRGASEGSEWLNGKEHGNFTGWRQFRKMMHGEDVKPLPAGYQLRTGDLS